LAESRRVQPPGCRTPPGGEDPASGLPAVSQLSPIRIHALAALRRRRFLNLKLVSAGAFPFRLPHPHPECGMGQQFMGTATCLPP